eukprot:2747312-Pleurochrysis_carterae.AAC.1
MPRGSSKRAAEDCDGVSSTQKKPQLLPEIDIPDRSAAEWRAKSGELTTDTELLVIALLMAARMPDG